jgi:hypothetical protein
MNMWGYTPSFLEEIAGRFPVFLDGALSGNSVKEEFYLPRTVGQLLREGKTRVRVLRSRDKWHGMTYAADKPLVVSELKALAAQGLYPADGLWK